MDRGAWRATVHGVARGRQALVTKPPPPKAGFSWWLRLQRICLLVQETQVRSFLTQGRSPREWSGHPLQYSCLENSMDRTAWCTIAHGVTKSQRRLSE